MKLRAVLFVLSVLIFMAGFLTSVTLMHREIIKDHQGIGIIFASLGVSVIILIIQTIKSDK